MRHNADVPNMPAAPATEREHCPQALTYIVELAGDGPLMTPNPTQRHERRLSGGFTLLEVLVTLLLLGLSAAIVVPVFRADPPDESFGTVLAAVRETAVRRAQTVELTVDTRGGWRLAAGDSTALASGHLSDGTRQLRIRVTPLGACFNEGPGVGGGGGSSITTLDALGCSLNGIR
jgi:prepilin-type N-terminal cleavage/methylation domain-containing protein